eukprot:2785631-Alexandrium_andersonii.AAC.1
MVGPYFRGRGHWIPGASPAYNLLASGPRIASIRNPARGSFQNSLQAFGGLSRAGPGRFGAAERVFCPFGHGWDRGLLGKGPRAHFDQ